MNKIQTIINIVLGLAVATLAFLQFKPASKPKKLDLSTEPVKVDASRTVNANDTTAVKDVAPVEFKIAYYNTDVLEKETNFFKDGGAYIKKLSEEADGKIGAINMDAQNKANKINEVKPTNETELAQMRNEMQVLSEKAQANIGQIREEYDNKINDYRKSQRIKFEKYLEQYNASKGYAYIIQYSDEIGLISYKNNSFDITQEIISGLNAVK